MHGKTLKQQQSTQKYQKKVRQVKIALETKKYL